MKRIFFKVPLGRFISEKLALSLYRDFTVRALRAKIVPPSLTLSSESSKSFHGRGVSERYRGVVEKLRCVPASNGNLLPYTIGQAFSFIQVEIERHEDLAVQLDALDAILIKVKDEGPTGPKGSVEYGKIDVFITNLWKESGLMPFLADASHLRKDLLDSENACSMLSICDAWTGSQLGTAFLKSVLNSFSAGNGASNVSGIGLESSLMEKINSFEYVYSLLDNSSMCFSPMSLVSAMKDVTKDDDNDISSSVEQKNANELYWRISDMELIMGISSLRTLFDDIVTSGEGDKMSDNKSLNALLVEADRIKIMTELKVYYALQAWVGLFQLSLSYYFTKENVAYGKKIFVNIDAAYDVDGLISWLMGLPSGNVLNTLISDLVVPEDAVTGGVRYDVITTMSDETSHEDAVDQNLAVFKRMMNFLHGLKTNSTLWEVYTKGAQRVGATPLRITKGRVNFDNFGVSFTQHGVFKGDNPRSFFDACNGMVFDWGLNLFNSSARTLFANRPLISTDVIKPYAYGTVVYSDYKAKLSETIGRLKKEEMLSGYAVSKENIPAIPMKRVVRSLQFLNLVVDTQLIRQGPASLLPVAPVRVTPISSKPDVAIVSKAVVGTYENALDEKAMQFQHYPPFSSKDNKGKPGEIASYSSVDDSLLAARLGISKDSLDRATTGSSSESKTSNDRGDIMLMRFVNQKNRKQIACGTIIEDDLLINMANCFWFIPRSYLPESVKMISVSEAIVPSETEDVNSRTLRIRDVDVFRIFSDPSSAGLVTVPFRLEGNVLHLNDIFTGLTGSDDVTMSLGPVNG